MSFGVDPSSEDQQPDWKTEFENETNHIKALMKDGHVFQAIQYIMTSFFNLLTNYNEGYRMGSQADIENILSQVQQDRNTIESAFDGNQAQSDSGLAQDALNAYADIKSELQKGEKEGIFSSTWVNQVLGEFEVQHTSGGDVGSGDIFQGQTTASDLANKWHTDWQGPSDQNDPPKPTTSPSIQGVTNALSAVSTDFSSQSSIAESKLKYYETWDEQYLTVQHSMMSNYIDEEKSPNTSMQSASS